ncbi:Eukaryotic translation initiation factor 2D [Tritrichomonas musculus]|uniref:Eukaryotic translation initiation factor 2D n=1 Tax=Tritrichomonas musculus TaxID=1915356 RepID=A0ABR2H9P2_9EUKA
MNATIFAYKQKDKDSKNTLFWTFNGCPYIYNHIPKQDKPKEEQNNQKPEKKDKKGKKEENKEDKIEPTLCPNIILVLEYPDLIPYVYTDEIAVEKVIGGAKLNAPGIKECPVPFQKGDVVAVRLLGQKDAFAVGVANISSNQLPTKEKGVGVYVSHVLKDQLWEMMISNRNDTS